jgi:hypothetical protein
LSAAVTADAENQSDIASSSIAASKANCDQRAASGCSSNLQFAMVILQFALEGRLAN